MKVLIFYHPDADGITAAAIVRHALQQRYGDVRFEYIRHGYLGEDRRLQELRPDGHTQIWAVDISFRPETTRRLQCAFGPDFVWVDHHISALEAWRDTGGRIRPASATRLTRPHGSPGTISSPHRRRLP